MSDDIERIHASVEITTWLILPADKSAEEVEATIRRKVHRNIDGEVEEIEILDREPSPDNPER